MQGLLKKFLLILLLFSVSGVASGVSEITLNDVKRPNGAILFIVDGLGSSYYYPEFTPFSLDGSELSKAITHNLTLETRILNIRTPNPVTGIAHSIIVTGRAEANEDLVGYPDATIYDITKQHGYANLAVMEKGDFMNMRGKQDIILYAENNSIEEPKMKIQSKSPPDGVYDLMYDWKIKLPDYLNNKTGVERYSAHNKWGIDAANAVTVSMLKNHPSQKFLLTVNVGAVDSGGHYLGDDDYIRLIEDIDRDIVPLCKNASDNDIALFFTADHGMSFAKKDAQRGGHSSDKYSSRQESLLIPLAIISPNAAPHIVNGEYGQEDIAPTLLSILDLPNHLQYADGEAIGIKNYASIFVKTDTEYSVSLWNDNRKVSEQSASELIFAGLPLNTSYTLRAIGPDGAYEESMFLDSDKQFKINKHESGLNKRNLIAIILILVVNISGFVIIKRIKD